MPVAQGSFTFGNQIDAPGSDYPTLTEALEDIIDLNNDLTLTQIADTTEPNRDVSISLVDLGSHKFTVVSDTPHNGDPNVGYTISYNATIEFRSDDVVSTHIGEMDVSTLHFVCTGPGPSVSNRMQFIGNHDDIIKVHDNLFNFGKAGDGAVFEGLDDGVDQRVWNNFFWDNLNNSNPIVELGELIGSGSGVFENNTVAIVSSASGQNSNRIGGDGTGWTVQNNVAFNDINGQGIDYNISFAIEDYNASKDVSASGSNSISNINPNASVFKSLDDTSSDFLKLAEVSILIDAGNAPLIIDNIAGITGNPRPGINLTTAMGAHEQLDLVSSSSSSSTSFDSSSSTTSSTSTSTTSSTSSTSTSTTSTSFDSSSSTSTSSTSFDNSSSTSTTSTSTSSTSTSSTSTTSTSTTSSSSTTFTSSTSSSSTSTTSTSATSSTSSTSTTSTSSTSTTSTSSTSTTSTSSSSTTFTSSTSTSSTSSTSTSTTSSSSTSNTSSSSTSRTSDSSSSSTSSTSTSTSFDSSSSTSTSSTSTTSTSSTSTTSTSTSTTSESSEADNVIMPRLTEPVPLCLPVIPAYSLGAGIRKGSIVEFHGNRRVVLDLRTKTVTGPRAPGMPVKKIPVSIRIAEGWFPLSKITIIKL